MIKSHRDLSDIKLLVASCAINTMSERYRVGIEPVKALVRILCAMALLLVGFAYQPPASAMIGDQSFASAAYVLPDGTIPDLCLSGDGSHDEKPMAAMVCDACLIASAILLPAAVDVVGEPLAVPLEGLALPQGDASNRRAFPPNAAPRAPPVLPLA
ncbi:hypothetical protein OCK02_24680 [Rhizobium sp. TRM96647]|jgi:hypothetical protein|uniref:hypothetical protein n=1 Tax=unclassified Rhizobium TaxID=2613769 RepID=UPI0021E7AEC0|nr:MULTISPECIES: hypothetical protein [unclassified Rhizobium]MCV3739363.1 hypothetical protein [Rhizobium sp. TRM96647]MCV3761029.1 hypothetical protein [Rhizobium sp. TRM96650]